MKKSESNLWKRIKNLKLKGQLFRIESNTINGIPDIGLSKYQINWHLTHFKNGGTSFILREGLSQRGLSEYQVFVVREPRNVNQVAVFQNLKDAIKKIQDA